ncbi:MAG: hypothetical protein ACYCPF_15640 [Streptosporangiaceae bacterium]
MRLLPVTAALAAALALTACGSLASSAKPAAAATRPPAASASPSSPPSPSPSPSPTHRADVPLPVAPGAGRRPQTTVRPRAHGRAFHAMITDLWLAVRTNKPRLARDAFFPVDAYKQVKAIYNPALDWRDRLWLDFTLDVHAAHALLGPHPMKARLIRVILDSPGAAWIPPGYCYNSVGYWHVANARVVYRLHGQVRSFGIASLISWRGVWYVVHFGGVLRGAVGMTDVPSAGTGYAGPQGGC